MTANKRIALNVIATYGRSLYALIIGLFCGRWTLMALGHTDYGLFGVVGGLTAFIAFFNGILGSAVGRFYAVSVGEASKCREDGIAKCRMWFTTAVLIHTILPALLMIVGYPIGIWAINNFLTIPPDRVQACVWVWRFVCATCFLHMASVPFNAMYTAKQYIAELTIYSFIKTTLNALFLYYMITHPGVWLTKYAFWQCLLGVTPQLIISLRACYTFSECKFEIKYIKHCWVNVKKLSGYAFWNAWGALGAMLRAQGIAVLVNKYFGPRANAGVAVGSSLSGHTNTLSGSMIGAFSPAIFNAWGAGDKDLARRLAYRICKLAALMIIVFALPLSLEVNEVLRLWLKNPPEYAAGICVFVMIMSIIDKMAVGHMICVNANGKIAMYQAFLGTSLVLTLPIAWLLVELDLGVVYSVGCAMVATMMFCASGRVWFARKLVGLSARYWLRHVCLPLLGLIVVSLIIGIIPRLFMGESFARVCVTTGMVEIALIPLAWFIVLDNDERKFMASRISKLLPSRK